MPCSRAEPRYFRPKPEPASPGTLRLHTGRYHILGDFGPAWYITDDTGRVVAAERVFMPLWMSQRRLEKRGERKMRELIEARERAQGRSGGIVGEEIIDRDAYIKHLEKEAGLR